MLLKGVWLTILGVLLLGQTSVQAASYLRVRKNGITYYYFNNREFKPSRQGEISPAAGLTPLEGALIGGSLALPGLAGEDHLAPFDAQAHIGTGARYLVCLLSKLGYPSPLPLAADHPGSRPLERHQDIPTLQAPEALAALICDNVSPYAREPRPELGRVKQVITASGRLPYCFPVAGPFSFHDGFEDYRSGGRLHQAIDIFAAEGTPVYAVTAGTVCTLATYNGAGLTLLMQGRDGRGYGYMHLQGYAPCLFEGKALKAGELIGYVGRTGLLTAPAHLHFQVYANHRIGKDNLVNPYPLLVQLCRGVGVTDLNQHRLAYLSEPQQNFHKIRVYRQRLPIVRPDRGGPSAVKNSSVLVIRNY